ncbi:MAG: Fic family protein [Flavobacterium sp.]
MPKELLKLVTFESMDSGNNKLTNQYFDVYISLLEVDITHAMEQLEQREWTAENFRFYTAVSVISSSRIEGETMEIDSYLKHKLQNISYLPNLTEKPNDLYAANEFARDHKLTLSNFLEAHRIATQHLLPERLRGVVRTNHMIIKDHQTQQVQYEAALASVVKKEFDDFWLEVEALISKELDLHHIFYYAAWMHLVFVKIHPFNDGNGRTARLLEKWFLATKLGEKAWYIPSENYYYHHLASYYQHLAGVGLFYEKLQYEKAIPFLLMLPNSLNR